MKFNNCLCACYVIGSDLDAKDTWGTKQSNVPPNGSNIRMLKF